MRILISGAGGFIGQFLSRRLCQQHKIFALDISEPEDNPPADNIQWINQDLTQPLVDALPEQIDVVIHLAQSRYYREFPKKADDIFQVNVQGTFHLLEYARHAKVKKFLFSSTGGVYGTQSQLLTEDTPAAPDNFYATSKYSAELLMVNYRPYFNTLIFRLFFVYGPGQKGMLMPTLLSKVQNEEMITIQGSPGLKINPIYIEDVVFAIEKALSTNQPKVLNIAGQEVISITDLVQIMAKYTGKQANIHYSTTDDTGGSLIADISQMKTILGYTPQTTLDTGIRQMIRLNQGNY